MTQYTIILSADPTDITEIVNYTMNKLYCLEPEYF